MCMFNVKFCGTKSSEWMAGHRTQLTDDRMSEARGARREEVISGESIAKPPVQCMQLITIKTIFD